MVINAVIMCGISGSGKTHYALKLEERGFIRLSIDALIWEKVGANLFNLTKEEQQQLFAECKAQVHRNLIDFLKKGENVVLDATHCKRSVRDEIRELCANIGVKPIFVYCSVDKEELWTRLSKRKGKGPDDLLVTHNELCQYFRGFERPEQDETDIISQNDLII